MTNHRNIMVEYEGVLSVVPHKPTFPKTPFPIAIKNDTNLSIFNQRFHMILCYEKASSEDSGWIVAGWTKTSMMIALSEKPLLAGRLIRRVEDGGLEIVPNDSGIRLIEAQIPISLDEFVSMKNKEHVQKQLVFWESIDHQDPQFFPLMYLQVTKFMCGAYAIGISCSILAADPLSMSSFLKRWANIHINLVNESKTPKLPLLYLPKFDKPNSTPLYDPHDATLEDQTSGQTFIFKFPQTNHEMQRAVALSCIHKVKRKLGHKVTPNFTLLAKDPLNDMIKIDTVCVENVLESSPDFNEINVTNSSWCDYIDADGINIAKGHKPTDSFCCIFSPAEEGLVMMISSELDTTVIVTIPTKNNVIQ